MKDETFTKLEEINVEHQKLLELTALNEISDQEKITSVSTFIERVRNGSQNILNTRDRNQLRAILRYWASWLFAHTQAYPDTTILPFQKSQKPSKVKIFLYSLSSLQLAVLILLLFLGMCIIFDVSRYFYIYSLVATSSREAARWGAAVGGGQGESPRYLDCEGIRIAAYRTSYTLSKYLNAKISIEYDHGPENGQTKVYASCPETARGTLSPDDVRLGDRIIVTVKYVYQPTMPGLSAIKIPITVSTARTILKFVPVGEAPTAVDPEMTPTSSGISGQVDSSWYIGGDISFQEESNCDSFTLIVSVPPYGKGSALKNWDPANLQIHSIKRGMILAQDHISFVNGSDLTIKIPKSSTDLSYLVRVNFGPVPVQSNIITFSPDCTRSVAKLQYKIPITENQNYDTFLKKYIQQSTGEEKGDSVDINWTVFAWGPVPGSEKWISEVEFIEDENLQHSFLWDSENIPPRLISDRKLLIYQNACQPGIQKYGVTYNGNLLTRWIILKTAPCVLK